ncbi:MAG: bifunctional phosphoglucose/phosphomannose isomerase [bacterium]
MELFRKWQVLDTGNMLSLLFGFHEQLRKGVELGEKVDIKYFDGFKPENIVLCGMGGSAIGGDFLRCYLSDELMIPFSVVRDYNLPSFVSNKTLLIASSYSGNTEETLSCFTEGIKRGSRIIGIASGGKLRDECGRMGLPFIHIPEGLPPRAALGYSFTPLIIFLNRLNLISDKREEIVKAADFLRENVERFRPELDVNENPAKSLALKLHGKLPIICTTTRHFEVVGIRFRGQINENSKMLAYSSVIPENNHNELVGWNILGKLKNLVQPVIVLDKLDHPRNIFRARFFADVMREKGVEAIVVETRGETLMERMLSVIQLGDFTSYYLAILNGIDPKPVRIIDRLKQALAEYNG